MDPFLKAKTGLRDSYFDTFQEEPDDVASMIIKTSYHHAFCNPYHWEQSGGFRKLVWD